MLVRRMLALVMIVMLFIVGCSSLDNNNEISIKDLVEKGSVDIGGNNYELVKGPVISYKYDGDNLIEQSKDGEKIVYCYNEKNMLSKEEIYSSDQLIATNHYEYDDNGKKVKLERVIELNEGSTTTTVYKHKANEIEAIHYDLNGEQSFVAYKELNDREQVIKTRTESKDGSWIMESIYTYEDENQIYHGLSDNGEMRQESFRKYNEHGDKVSNVLVLYSDDSRLQGEYYLNEYEGSKLVKQTIYHVSSELTEDEAKNIAKSLK